MQTGEEATAVMWAEGDWRPGMWDLRDSGHISRWS